MRRGVEHHECQVPAGRGLSHVHMLINGTNKSVGARDVMMDDVTTDHQRSLAAVVIKRSFIDPSNRNTTGEHWPGRAVLMSAARWSWMFGSVTSVACCCIVIFWLLRLEYKLLSLTYEFLTTSQPDYLHNLISVQSVHVEPAPHPLSLQLDNLCLPHYKSPIAFLDMNDI